MKSLRLGSGVVMGVALLFTILALATPAWITDSRASVGLFKAQAGGISLDVVKGNAEKVAISFIVLAMVSLLPASILVIYAALVEEKEKLAKIGGALAVVGALCLLIAMATYTGLAKDVVDLAITINWGYSFALGWVAFCLALIAGPVAIVAN